MSPTAPEPTWLPQLALLLRDQSGVAARWQLHALGAQPHDVARMRRRRDLTTLHPGVYVDHTGRVTWAQRAWGAVLHHHPAALWGASALRAADGPGRRGSEDALVHVAIDRRRSSPRPVEGIVVHPVVRLEETVLWHLAPPRRRYEEAVLDVATSVPSDLDAVAVLTGAVGSRATTADRLLATLAERPRARRRRWLVQVLTDARDGTHSALEHGYLTRIERPHALPRAHRQRRERTPTGVVYRDATYADSGAYVELDSRLEHGDPERWDADLERDLDALAAGRATARLGWRQVFGRPCSTTSKVVAFLRGRGVPTPARACGPGCPV